MLNRIYFLFLLFCYTAIHAQVSLPHLVGDNMVLQRDQSVKIWGWAAPGEMVSISFNNITHIIKTGNDKKWMITLPAMKEGGPYNMIIKASNEIVLKNILMGDVWLCSGQSNMELSMDRIRQKYTDEIAHSENSKIRQFTILPRKYSFTPLQDVEGKWVTANPKNIGQFTAVGYFFAKALYEKYQVPIGLIHSSWGGTPAEAWTSEKGLKEFPSYLAKANYFKDSTHLTAVIQKDKAVKDGWNRQIAQTDKGLLANGISWSDTNYNASLWKSMMMPGYWQNNGLGNIDGVVWLRKEINVPHAAIGEDAFVELGNIDDLDTTYFNGVVIGNTPNKYISRRYLVPAHLLKEGKNVITVRVINREGNGGFIKDKHYRLLLKGATIDLAGNWQFQIGVSVKPLPVNNFTIIPYQPSAMFNGMIAPLIPYSIKGVIWYQGEANSPKALEYRKLLPAMITDWRTRWGQADFPFLIVQLANYMQVKENPSESNWAELREAQAIIAETMTNSGLAVTIDIGETNDVHPSNKREVGNRLALIAQKVAYHDPSIVSSGPTYQSMKKEGNKIMLSFANVGSGLMPGNDTLKQFAIAGNDRNFVWAHAKIEKGKVIVWSEEIVNPIAVRYAWADNPLGCNLYNKEGLPASPFRTDNWNK